MIAQLKIPPSATATRGNTACLGGVHSGAARLCPKRRVRLAALVAVTALLSAASAAPIRIATWDLATSEASSNGAYDLAILRAAATLEKVAPDVILLQGARNWESCTRLAGALGPDRYRVLVCSAIRDPRTGKPARRQVAVLARRTAYFTWADGWASQTNGTGGYAFAAIQIEQERVGFFAVQLNPELRAALETYEKSRSTDAPPKTVQDWLQAVNTFRQWTANRVGVIVIAGGFDSTARGNALSDARLASAILGAPLEQPIRWVARDSSPALTPDHVFGRATPDTDSPPGVVLDRFPAVCDLELGSGAWPTLREQVQATADSPSKTKAAITAPAVSFPLLGWVTLGLGGTTALLAFGWLRGRRKRSRPTRALLRRYAESNHPAPAAYTVILAPLPTASSGAEPPSPPPPHAVVVLEKPGATQTQSLAWQERALAAEQRAERAHEVIRHGLIPHLRAWLKQKVLRRLVSERADLLKTQEATTRTVLAVDERLSRIEAQIAQQTSEYQRRLEELTRELLAAKEENRELIRARIAQIRNEMEAARARMLAQAEEESL